MNYPKRIDILKIIVIVSFGYQAINVDAIKPNCAMFLKSVRTYNKLNLDSQQKTMARNFFQHYNTAISTHSTWLSDALRSAKHATDVGEIQKLKRTIIAQLKAKQDIVISGVNTRTRDLNAIKAKARALCGDVDGAMLNIVAMGHHHMDAFAATKALHSDHYLVDFVPLQIPTMLHTKLINPMRRQRTANVREWHTTGIDVASKEFLIIVRQFKHQIDETMKSMNTEFKFRTNHSGSVATDWNNFIKNVIPSVPDFAEKKHEALLEYDESGIMGSEKMSDVAKYIEDKFDAEVGALNGKGKEIIDKLIEFNYVFYH